MHSLNTKSFVISQIAALLNGNYFEKWIEILLKQILN